MKIKYLFLSIFVLFLVSCSSISPTPTYVSKNIYKPISHPPSFSFVEIDPNNIDIKYISRMKKYDKIISICPVPIYVINQETFFFDYTTNMEVLAVGNQKLFGLYVYKSKSKGYPEEFIFINKNLTPTQIITTFAHEYGHLTHRRNKCICFQSGNIILAEKHALENELKMGMEYNSYEMINSSMNTMLLTMIDGLETKKFNIYHIAISEIIKEDVWAGASNYLLGLEIKKIIESEIKRIINTDKIL